MRKILFIIFISLVVANSSYAQEYKLYLIMAHPFYDAEPFPSYLFSLKTANKSLDTIQQLSTNKEALREVKYYHEYKKIVIVKDGWFLTENTHKVIQVLNMDASHRLDSINLDSLNYGYNNSWLFNLTSSKSLFGIELYNSKLSKKRILLGVDINNLAIEEFDPEFFKHAEISGNTGSCLLSFDGLSAYTNFKNGELRIPESSDTAKRPTFPIQLPEEYQLHKKERRSIVINNSSAFVFSLSNSQSSEKDLGFTDLAILNKESNTWFKQRIKGNTDNMIRSFNNWMVGTVYSDNKIFDVKGRLKDKIKRVSPGKEKRRKKISKTGMPADYRFDYFGVYSPGILYMLNVKTRDYLEWNTGQGDSEILLVENNEVYYRVNDEIFKAPIINGKKLGKAQLLIKNEMVPDIHWAFISQ
jgi:hypothetical protein